MGPGPGPAAAHAAAFTPYAQFLIRKKARQLCRSPGFTRSDAEDVEQDLAVAWLGKVHQYDPSRGASIDTFADRVITSAARMVLRARKRLKRAAGLRAASLDRDAVVVDGRPVPLADAVGPDDHDRRTGATAPPDADLAAAVETALTDLPAFEAAVAKAMEDRSVLAAAKELGVSRRRIYAAIEVVRHRLAEAGLNPQDDD